MKYHQHGILNIFSYQSRISNNISIMLHWLIISFSELICKTSNVSGLFWNINSIAILNPVLGRNLVK